VSLDRVDALISIRQSADRSTADVAAALTDRFGRVVELQSGQAVLINGSPLTGPDASGKYHVSVAVADQYTISVNEPTRGVAQTTVAAPPELALVSPTAGATVSLTGFGVQWSNADAALKVELALDQTLLDEQRTRDFGPLTDSGSTSFDAADLAVFGQGAPLLLTITRVSQQADLAGLHTGSVAVERSVGVTLTPGS
jgi:hypothetical protein